MTSIIFDFKSIRSRMLGEDKMKPESERAIEPTVNLGTYCLNCGCDSWKKHGRQFYICTNCSNAQVHP